MTHTLKTIQPYFDQVIKGEKTFELRKNDRNFQIGDILILQEFDDGAYTGREKDFVVTYILKDCPQFGLMDGYAILGIKEDEPY